MIFTDIISRTFESIVRDPRPPGCARVDGEITITDCMDEKRRFLRWPDGAIRKVLFIFLFFVNLIYIIFN